MDLRLDIAVQVTARLPWPAGAVEASKSIRFEGSDEPSLPVNWRFAESIASLKGYEATSWFGLLAPCSGP